jgi:hypothetical protein
VGEVIARFPELVETQALVRLLTVGDASSLLRLTGPAVSAAGSLLADEATREITLPRLATLAKPELHSSAMLLLHGVGKVSDDDVGELPAPDQQYIRFCAGDAPRVRTPDAALDYIDECRTLQLTRLPTDRLRALSTRLFEGEVTELEALEIAECVFS